MGLVAIWCMHYVGNRGIILGNGDARIQLVYSSGYTALSSIIPIVALFIAFAIADRRHRGKKFLMFALVLSGICAGLAIVGMHYTANLGVSNYHIDFDHRYVGGAIIIACAACVLALTLIFMLQDLWINFFYMRLVCALVIAGAVTGMHYEGTVGTSYRLKYALNGSGTNGLRNTNVITAVVIVSIESRTSIKQN
jgi:NO-binding membrane sensor protein with MHYT domain